ncbi:head decoration protein [Roseitranquillus sediminis]|uniref:head decoration protein n=1 Tax=Roseitranquillus sediminis TaxID=2809051 RepID=UPI001D0C6D65|nr:head decoration protein [Roseitranquillus sediminis]MBM9592940.1 head decoration protein [Roseitranquillus sediminis]
MAQVLTEGPHTGGFLVWEAFRDYCREVVTIAAGMLEPGTVLGKITASGNYAAHDPAAVDGTETAVAVLWGKADASGGEVPAVALVRGPAIVNRHDLVFAGTPSEAEIAAAHADLLAAGVLVR